MANECSVGKNYGQIAEANRKVNDGTSKKILYIRQRTFPEIQAL